MNQTKPKKSGSFVDAYRNSLLKWGGWTARSVDDDTHLATEVSEHVRDLYPAGLIPRRYREEHRNDEWRQVAPMARAFLNAMLVQEFDRWTDGPGCIHNLLELTESPIEAALLMALILCGREHFIKVVVDGHDRTSKYPFRVCYEARSGRTLLIQPQATIGEYRVDFLLRFNGINRQSIESDSPRPEDHWRDVHIERQVIIECDGHDYHERTKEQARKDKSRDRALQSLGYPVYRYTGSEIYDHAFGCAAEAVKVLSGSDFEDDGQQ